MAFTEPERPSEFLGYIAEIGIFDLSCSCDIDLDPMTFIYELDPHTLEIQAKTYRMCKYELPTSFENYCLTDRHNGHYKTTSLHG